MVSVVAGIVVLASYIYLAPGLPDVATLKEVHLQTPLRVYSSDHKLIAVYGEMRRKSIRYDSIPPVVLNAFLAAEDDRYFHHPGVDYQGLLRAAYHLAKTGEKGQGGSTITMQLARNFFLTPERTYLRKVKEIFLALSMEHALTKEEILELYLNKIYFGNRAYGIGAAAEAYYGLNVEELSLEQAAMIAGLPKAPSTDNPVINPEAAKQRRNYVLNRMFALSYIDKEAYTAGINASVEARLHVPVVEVDAPYVGEMVRAKLFSRYGDKAYTDGYVVYTTLQSDLQTYADQALDQALLEYDVRHGYRGPEDKIESSVLTDKVMLRSKLAGLRNSGDLQPAVVTRVDAKQAAVSTNGDDQIIIDWDGMKWARSYINENSLGATPKSAADILNVGDIVRIRQGGENAWSLSQLPEVEGALVSLRPDNGAVVALVGGFDFNRSKFNRAVQARRQPGSSFKPFVYSAALEDGFTPATLINDAPVVFDDASMEKAWRPQNYSGRFYGPTRMREALTESRNMVSIRLLSSIGPEYAIRHIEKFGFDAARLPRNLTLALGSGAVTPMELATGYAVFANGGYRVESHFISRIESSDGELIYADDAPSVVTCQQNCLQSEQNLDIKETKDASVAQRVIPAENIYQMVSMMQDVIKYGTGRKALALGRNDLSGKTGTTNDQHDAWFSGYNRDLVSTVWVGFDQLKPLGNREVGGVAALPMWMSYMGNALKGQPEHTLEQPEGIIRIQIDPVSGLLASSGDPKAIWETFREGYQPTRAAEDFQPISPTAGGSRIDIPEQLF